MPLSASTLAEMFKGPLFDSDLPALEYLSDRFVDYLAESSVAGVPAQRPALVPVRAAFLAGITGINTPGAGPAKLLAAFTGGWGALSVAVTTIYAGAPITGPATPPPGLASIPTVLLTTLPPNQAQNLSRDAAADTVAAVLHPLNLGALAPSVPSPLPIT